MSDWKPNCGEGIEKLYAWIATEPDGGEGVCSHFGDGVHLPLIGADRERIESLRPFAEALRRATGYPVKLKVFAGGTCSMNSPEAGESEDKARKAAETLAGYEDRFGRIERRLIVLTWSECSPPCKPSSAFQRSGCCCASPPRWERSDEMSDPGRSILSAGACRCRATLTR